MLEKIVEEKLEKEFSLRLDETLVKVYDGKEYTVAKDDEISNLASFIATNDIKKVFEDISDEEKMEFDDEEIMLKWIYTNHFSIIFTFRLPNGALIKKEVKVLKPEQMRKDVYNKYLSAFNELKRRQRALEEVAKRKIEEEKKRRETEEIIRRFPRLQEENEELKKRIGELSEEIKILTSIVKKKVSEDEVYEDEEEGEEKLSDEEKEYLREHVFDC